MSAASYPPRSGTKLVLSRLVALPRTRLGPSWARHWLVSCWGLAWACPWPVTGLSNRPLPCLGLNSYCPGLSHCQRPVQARPGPVTGLSAVGDLPGPVLGPSLACRTAPCPVWACPETVSACQTDVVLPGPVLDPSLGCRSLGIWLGPVTGPVPGLSLTETRLAPGPVLGPSLASRTTPRLVWYLGLSLARRWLVALTCDSSGTWACPWPVTGWSH